LLAANRPEVIHDGRMSNDDRYRDDEQAMLLSLFRYGVIAPLVEQGTFDRGDVSERIKEIVSRSYYRPAVGEITVTERTVYAWLRAYRTGGIEALRPKRRSDLGKSRVLHDAVLDRAIRLRKEQKKRWTSTLIDIMQREGTLVGQPSFHRSTLDRHLDQTGMSRRQLKTLGEKRTIKMQFDAFGDLWVGDYKHGLPTLAPDGQLKTAKLSAFLDHKTRYPVSDRWYWAENIASQRDTLLRAFLRWGPAKNIYVDRGAVYRAEQLAYSLLRIDINLIHSRAYYSQGRGLIEKWWQVTDAFLAEVQLRAEPYTLNELNRVWEAFRELRYCQKIHSAIGITPNEAVKDIEKKTLDPQVVRELFLVKKKHKVHRKTSCITLYGREYLVESFLKGKWVTVRYDPADFSSVVIYDQDKRIQRAFIRPLNEIPQPHPEPESLPPSVDYLALLREDFDQKLLEHAQPLAYSDLVAAAEFDQTAFIHLVCQLAGLKKQPGVVRELSVFWETFGPVPEDLVRIGTEHAVRLHTRGRHVRVYLHAIRTLVLAHIKST
jgi:transposase InsO family protein